MDSNSIGAELGIEGLEESHKGQLTLLREALIYTQGYVEHCVESNRDNLSEESFKLFSSKSLETLFQITSNYFYILQDELSNSPNKLFKHHSENLVEEYPKYPVQNIQMIDVYYENCHSPKKIDYINKVLKQITYPEVSTELKNETILTTINFLIGLKSNELDTDQYVKRFFDLTKTLSDLGLLPEEVKNAVVEHESSWKIFEDSKMRVFDKGLGRNLTPAKSLLQHYRDNNELLSKAILPLKEYKELLLKNSMPK